MCVCLCIHIYIYIKCECGYANKQFSNLAFGIGKFVPATKLCLHFLE